MTESVMQFVCLSGHVSDVEYTPDQEERGAIIACPRCGKRASWMRSRPPIAVTNKQAANLDPRQR